MESRELTETKEAILAAFRRFEIKPRERLPFQSLLGEKFRWAEWMSEYFEAALASLVEEGTIEYVPYPKGYRLLKAV